MGLTSGGNNLFQYCFLLNLFSAYQISFCDTSTSNVLEISTQNLHNVSTTKTTTSGFLVSTPLASQQPTLNSQQWIVDIKESTSEMPVPGGKFAYQYNITNTGYKTETMNVTATVDNYILNAWVTRPICVLRPGHSHSGLINIHVAGKARPGLERKVKITVSDNHGRSQHFQRFIVIREDAMNTDANPPEIIFLNFITSCDKTGNKRMSCGLGNWTVLFSAQDQESGLSIIDVDDHSISSVWTEQYSRDQVIRPINGKISTDCCKKRTVIIVTDNNGNTIRIPIYFPSNSSLLHSPVSHRAHSVKTTAIIVSVFASCLLLVIISTVTVQNRSKLQCYRRKKQTGKDLQLRQRPANRF